jgi:hypothetical protein
MGKAEGVKLKGKSSFFRKKSGESREDVAENSSYLQTQVHGWTTWYYCISKA